MQICCGQNYAGTINKCLFPYNVKSVGGLCSFMTAKKVLTWIIQEIAFLEHGTVNAKVSACIQY